MAVRIMRWRFRHDADAKHRFPLLIQQFELPFGILRKLAQDAARHVGADAGHLFPRGAVIGALGALIGGTDIPAVADAKVVERHGRKPLRDGRCLSPEPARAVVGRWKRIKVRAQIR